MAESESHKRAKRKAAGKAGKTEVQLKDGRRLDAETAIKATEVELSGDPKKLEQAAKRLKIRGKPQKVLQVPDSDMDKAAAAMRAIGIGGTVKNKAGTRRRSIRKRA